MFSQHGSIETHNGLVINDAVFTRYYVQHLNVSHNL